MFFSRSISLGPAESARWIMLDCATAAQCHFGNSQCQTRAVWHRGPVTGTVRPSHCRYTAGGQGSSNHSLFLPHPNRWSPLSWPSIDGYLVLPRKCCCQDVKHGFPFLLGFPLPQLPLLAASLGQTRAYSPFFFFVRALHNDPQDEPPRRFRGICLSCSRTAVRYFNQLFPRVLGRTDGLVGGFVDQVSFGQTGRKASSEFTNSILCIRGTARDSIDRGAARVYQNGFLAGPTPRAYAIRLADLCRPPTPRDIKAYWRTFIDVRDMMFLFLLSIR